MKRSIFLLILSAFLLTACGGAATGASPIAWIDKPLPDSQYLIGPIDLLIHANAPQGVAAVAFFVNDQLAEALPVSDGTKPFITVPHVWTPPGAGTYTLSFAAQDVNGTWGASSEVTIKVVTQFSDPLEGSSFAVDNEPPPVVVTNTAPPPPATKTPTNIPPTSTNTAPPPPPTNPPTPPDTERPVILKLEWSPTSPNEDQAVSFSVLATDNVGVTRIEIYFVRQGNGNTNPVHVCTNSNSCEYNASAGFTWGTYSYYAIAYDAAGNQVSTFTQTVQVLQVIK